MPTFSKDERLKSRKTIALLFKGGHSFVAYPMRVVWTEIGPDAPAEAGLALPGVAQVAISVPKKHFKTAVARNLLGWTLIVLGVLMLVLPGQGVLTVLAGVVLADVPGKRGMIRRLLATGPVLRAVTALRERAGQPPLLLPADD